ncbi:MAG: hypothetical protein NVSMB70_02330 [Chamaesiphon sp.]
MTYLAPGTRLRDRYQIEREIGRGGYSVVYQALDIQLNFLVAVKLVVPPPALADKVRERTRREARAIRSLSHPHIVSVLDLVEEGPLLALIVDLVSGSNLQQLVSKEQMLAIDLTVQLGQEISSALSQAHRQGILHRDVKPQNILIDENRHALLTDFGSAKIEGQTTLTQTGALVGTLDYLAPEVFSGQRSDARSDIYALGMTLFFALTGKLPARSSPHMPPAPSVSGYHPKALRPDVPTWLDETVSRATRAEAGARFPTASSLLEALTEHKVKLPFVPSMSQISTCYTCGAPDPLGLVICPSCGGTATENATTMILIQSPQQLSEHQRVTTTLAQLLNVPTTTATLNEVVQGYKPLIQVPASSASRIVKQLTMHQVNARALPKEQLWKQIPLSFYGMLSGVLGFGTWVGLTTVSPFLLTTPLVAAVLFARAYQSLEKPFLVTQKSAVKLPVSLKAKVLRTATALPSGTAHKLLADVLFIGQNLFPTLKENKLQPESVKYLTELLTSACDAALALGRLDETLMRLETQRTQFTQLPYSWTEGFNQCEQTRDSLVQRLLETIATLGLAQSQAVAAPEGAGQKLSQLTLELRSELEIQSEVAKELQVLLNPNLPDKA